MDIINNRTFLGVQVVGQVISALASRQSKRDKTDGTKPQPFGAEITYRTFLVNSMGGKALSTLAL